MAPGNGGTRDFNIPIPAIEIERLRDFAKENRCSTIIGPEAPLAAGIVDEFSKADLPIFGPSSGQARLETSKVYAKEFMKSHDIPTADFQVFDDVQQALDFAARSQGNVVVKADGLAAGKGVFVCSSMAEAETAIRHILENKAFGTAGDKIVVEEKLRGREASFLFLTDGETSVDFGTAVDHKRAFDGDKGPNTGGMGAFSPASEIMSEHSHLIKERIVNPVVKFSGFRGFLYVGLMFDESDSPMVLEFNARLGDPEAQVILPRLETDLLDVVLGANVGQLRGVAMKWNAWNSCTVVMCSEDYPQHPKIGDPINGIPDAMAMKNVIVFHSGTVARDSSVFTNGGRVLSVTGLGATKQDAAKKAYEGVSLISWRGERHRSDIAS